MKGIGSRSGRVLASAAVLCVLLSTIAAGAERLEVGIDKTVVLDLKRAASVISVANPGIADVNVQSPTLVIVIGKSLGTTSLDLLDAQRNPIATYDVVVTPESTDHVTINHGVDGVKTLACQPRCIRVSNPGKDPEPGGGGGGGAGGGGILSQLGGGAKGAKK